MTRQENPEDEDSATSVPSLAPAWLVDDPCPAWCLGDHPVDQHVEDRAHISQVIHVPVIMATVPPYRAQRSSAGANTNADCDANDEVDEDPIVAAEFIVSMRRYAGQTDTWVYIGQGEDIQHGFDITVESARRLKGVISTVLRRQ